MESETLKIPAQKLNDEYQNIFAKCTMTGEAHTNLHHYLIPIGNLLKEIEHADPEKGLMAVSKLEEHLHSYNNYFE